MTENSRIKLILWGAGFGTMEKCEKAAAALVEKGYCKQTEVAERIFGELESLLKMHILPVAKMGVIEIEKEPFLFIEPNDYVELKKRYTEGKR